MADDAKIEALESALAEALRAREVLLSSISHDLRNPLNTFAMSAGLLRDDLERGEADPARALSLLGRMDRAVERMQRLIDDLHEASLVEAKAIKLARTATATTAIIADAVKAAGEQLKDRGIDVTPGHVEDKKVEGDRVRLVQALVKLVTYCARATGEGGTITIAAEDGEGVVTFAVRAIGPRGAAIRLEPGKGGLPLLIARGLVEAHGAKLHDQSDAAVRWAFTLPAVS